MGMTDVIIVAILAAIIGAAAWYVIRAKRRGAKCVGCSVEGGCSRKRGEAQSCGCGCGGGCHADAEK